jgi:hypothetical protein
VPTFPVSAGIVTAARTDTLAMVINDKSKNTFFMTFVVCLIDLIDSII